MQVRVARAGKPPRFPHDYQPTRRVPVEAGADQRQKVVVAVAPPNPVDLDKVEWWDDKDDLPVDEEHDLYEQLYGSAPIERSIDDFYLDDELSP